MALMRGQVQHVAVHGAAGALEADITDLAASAWPLRGGHQDEGALAALDLPDALFAGVDRSQSLLGQCGTMLRSQPIGDRLFIDGILHDRPIEPSFYDGWKAQEVIEAALASSRTGQRATIGTSEPT
jgi:predicted dehydrogenase